MNKLFFLFFPIPIWKQCISTSLTAVIQFISLLYHLSGEWKHLTILSRSVSLERGPRDPTYGDQRRLTTVLEVEEVDELEETEETEETMEVEETELEKLETQKTISDKDLVWVT